MKEKLKQSNVNKESRQLFKNMLNGFALHEIICDKNGKPVDYRFLDVNPAFEDLTGLKAEAVIGRSLTEVLPDTEEYWIDIFGKVALFGESIRFERYARQLNKHFEVIAYQTVTGCFATLFQDITERKEAENRTNELLKISKAREREISSLLRGANAVLEHDDFQAVARKIFDICREIIGAQSGYVALLSDDGAENELLFLEAGGLPCSVDPNLPMPIRGLRQEAYVSNKTVYHNDFMNSEWVKFMPKGHVTLRNVLFAPLVVGSNTVGVIGLANKANDFNDNDVKLATGFGLQAAIALQNSKNLEEIMEAEKRHKKINDALNVMIDKRDNDRKILEEKVLFNAKELIQPIINNIKNSKLTDNQKAYVDTLEIFLEEIVSPFSRAMHATYKDLTMSEIKVANLIKEGKTTKEIATILNSTPRAIDFHRQNLRKKLGLTNRKANLSSHLLSLLK